MIIDDLGRIPMSQHLAATLARAASYADAQQHASVTLEHLLLALAEDPDAAIVLRSSNVDLARLAGEVSTHIGRIDDRRDPSVPGQVLISPDLKRILEAAAAAARQGRRPEINGANVRAAIDGDGKSTAANLLRIQGLTFEQAIRALQRVASATRTETAPQPSSSRSSGTTEDILANARERVQSRSAQGQPRPSQGQPPPAPVPSPAAPIQPELAGAPGMEAARPSAEQHSPVVPQWEPAAPAPPVREPKVTQPPVWTAPPPTDRARAAEETGFRPPPASAPAGVPPPLQVPPGQRTQPPAGPGSTAPPPPLKPHPSAPFQNAPVPGSGPPGASMPSTFGQPPNRPGLPAQQPRPPQQAGPAGGVPAGSPRQRRPGKNVWVAAGQFVENIPRKMRVGVSMVVEARIGRRDVKAIAEGMDGGAAIVRHEITVTKAMSVRLRSPDGGFFIESSSPETQWIEGAPGFDGDYASWRWTITPRERGKQRLQLLASARTVGDDGLTAETALPDQMVEVKVTVNYARSAARLAGWMTAAVIGGLLARFGESMFVPLISILRGGG
jgi:hypothetical protein